MSVERGRGADHELGCGHAGAGLLAGTTTSSIILGIAGDTISGLGLDPAQRKAWIDNIPMAYAVTYIFGTAWFHGGHRVEIAGQGRGGAELCYAGEGLGERRRMR